MMRPQLHQRDEQDDASRGNAQSPYRSQGGATGVDAFDDIHRLHMCAKLRCRLTGPECRLLATPGPSGRARSRSGLPPTPEVAGTLCDGLKLTQSCHLSPTHLPDGSTMSVRSSNVSAIVTEDDHDLYPCPEPARWAYTARSMSHRVCIGGLMRVNSCSVTRRGGG